MLGHNLAFSKSKDTNASSESTLVNLIAGEALGYPRVVMTVAGKIKLFAPSTGDYWFGSWNHN